MNPILSHALIGVCTLVIGVCVGYSIREQGKFNSQVVLNFSVAIISICALSGLLVAINEYRAATECQSEYNVNLTKAIKERAEATDADRHSTRVALDVVLDPTSDQTRRLQALEKWRDDLAKADKVRTDNPIPVTPSCAVKEQ